jgi:glycogen synthase
MKEDNNINILMTTDTIGGVWTYCMDLCRALQLYDVKIHLATMGARMKNWQKREVEALENVCVYETTFMLEWMHNPWADIRKCGDWLLMLEQKIEPDIVHLNSLAYGALPFKAPVIVVAHSDVYTWFLSVKKQLPPAEWNCYFHCVKKGLQNADVVIAPSQAMMDAIKENYLIAGECRVLYNGRGQHLFRQSRKEYIILSMGRLWDEAKNVKLLTDSASFINAPIKIAGASSFDQCSFPVPENVQFLGRLSTEQIAKQLSTAAIYVLPAKYEPFGLSALEAGLSGCALVLGDIPSLKEIWSDAAIYIDTDDAMGLANTINTLLSDKELLEYYQSKALMRAKLFSSETMCKEYIYLYRQLMAQGQERSKQELA